MLLGGRAAGRGDRREVLGGPSARPARKMEINCPILAVNGSR